jgi:hypothetical protein
MATIQAPSARGPDPPGTSHGLPFQLVDPVHSGRHSITIKQEEVVKRGSRFVILGVVALFAMLVSSTGLFAQAKEATAAAKKYLAALEGLQFKTAYGFLTPDDQAFKALPKYLEDYPLVMIKALRMGDKNYFRYAVKEAQVDGDDVLVSVTTRDMVVPGQADMEFPIGMMYTFFLKDEMKKNKQKADDPAQVLAAFKKMLAANGMKEIPYGAVTRVLRMQKVKTAWLVKKGWKEEAAKAQQAAQENVYENEAQNYVQQAMTGNREFDWTIEQVQGYQSKAPSNAKIAANLATLTKAQNDLGLIEVTVTGVSPTGTITFQIANKSEVPVYSLGLSYTNFNYQGDELMGGKRDIQISTDKLDPPAPDGCPPGYTGTFSLDQGDDGKNMMDNLGWKATEAKLMRAGFQKAQ